MISCTEFIPAYSELFTFLDETYGRPEVERFWTYLFAPTGKGIPLINFAKKDGLRGCWDYWSGTLQEEAADCTRYFNEKAGWMSSDMHYCPSKGRLLELQKEIGLVPYYDYCGHCDYYRAALDQVGLRWIRDHIHVDKASCSSILYDPKVFKGMMVLDQDTVMMECATKDSKYFHPDFHSSMNMGIDFVAVQHGEEALREYLTMYTKHVYKPVFREMETDALGAIEAKIRDTYRLEKAEDAMTVENDGKQLSVQIAYCPAVKHLRETGRDVSAWFRDSTEVVMQTLAEQAGLTFTMERYDPETGAAAYSFIR
ncbi:MAG: hypothetical protein VB055_06705 [Oscillospiraceae bacterium]|nr:hypothetical protein [Oscillospiraceae bacterium]